MATTLGVEPSDEDLRAVSGFLAVLLPAFRELEELVPPTVVPAAVFRPEGE
jgi:hypothetical protein